MNSLVKYYRKMKNLIYRIKTAFLILKTKNYICFVCKYKNGLYSQDIVKSVGFNIWEAENLLEKKLRELKTEMEISKLCYRCKKNEIPWKD